MENVENCSKDIYLHFLDRELLTTLGIYDVLPYNVIVDNFRYLLFMTYEPFYMSSALIFENRFAKKLFELFPELFTFQHIQLSLKEDSLKTLILVKQEQYSHAKNKYHFYFDDTWKFVMDKGVSFRNKEMDTGKFLDKAIPNDIINNGIIKSSKKMNLKINKKVTKKITPYIIESIYERKNKALTKLLFNKNYQDFHVNENLQKIINTKITENYINAYISEYGGTIATGLSFGIDYFSYLSPTFPYHHIPIWQQLYHILGVTSFLRKATSTEIIEIRESYIFQNFVNDIRNILQLQINQNKNIKIFEIIHYLRQSIQVKYIQVKTVDDFLLILSSLSLKDELILTKTTQTIVPVEGLNKIYKKTNLLFLASNPTDTVKLNLDKEYRVVSEALQRGENKNKFNIYIHWNSTALDIQNAILEYSPEIIHFTGHGKESDQELIELSEKFGIKNVGQSGILLHGDNDKTSIATTQAISNMFKILSEKINIKIVVLSACYSSEQAKEISYYIPYVIGMSNEISLNTATNFAESFYQRYILMKENIEYNFKLSKNTIELSNKDDFNVPVLYRNGEIYTEGSVG